MKYIIHRDSNVSNIREVTLVAKETIRRSVHKRPVTPDRSQKVYNHSPDGFEFGYIGSGPAQLALAILLDLTNDRSLSIQLHQLFKHDFLATMKHPGGEIEDSAIRGWIHKQLKETND